MRWLTYTVLTSTINQHTDKTVLPTAALVRRCVTLFQRRKNVWREINRDDRRLIVMLTARLITPMSCLQDGIYPSPLLCLKTIWKPENPSPNSSARKAQQNQRESRMLMLNEHLREKEYTYKYMQKTNSSSTGAESFSKWQVFTNKFTDVTLAVERLS